MKVIFSISPDRTSHLRWAVLALAIITSISLQASDYGHLAINVRCPGSEQSLSGGVMLVNNTLTQPAELGHKVIVGGSVVTYPTMDHSQIGRQILFSTLVRLTDEREYTDISILDKSINIGSSFYKRAPLSSARMDSLCHLYQMGTLLILNQVVCQSVTECFQSDEYQYYAYTQMISSSHWTVYQRGKGEETITRQDTLLWEGDGISIDRALQELPTREEAAMALTELVGSRMVDRLFVHWQTVDRYLYMDRNSQISTGLTAFRQGRWQQAIEAWLKVYQLPKSKQSISLKAKAAANIAIAYEMMDQLEVAEEWVQAAIRQWDEKESVEAEQEEANLRNYAKQLKKRQIDKTQLP